MIPKKIHYCWFGGGPKPTVFKKCIDSWKKYMPEYEIIEWNEENTDLKFNKFVEDAYNAGAWAFVSDVVRLKVLYENGGIYMDTDVELNDSFEQWNCYDSFFFFQNHYQINTGMGFGSVKENPLIKHMLDAYKDIVFDESKLLLISSPNIITSVIKSHISTFCAYGQTQCINNQLFLDGDEYWGRAKHYGDFSWKSKETKEILKFTKKKHGSWKIKKIFRNPQIFRFLDECHLHMVSKMYTFIAYDFIDYGPVYWIVKIWHKIIHRS